MTATVTSAPLTDPVLGSLYEIPISVTGGSLANCYADMVIDVGTTPLSNDVGTLFVRKNASSGNLRIRMSPFGEVPVNTGHYLTVRDEVIPASKRIRLVGIEDDAGLQTDFIQYHNYDEAYSNQNSAIRPTLELSNGIGGYPRHAGWVDATYGGQDVRTVTLSASGSQTWGSSISSVTWYVGALGLNGATQTGSTVTIQMAPGYKLVRCRIVLANGAREDFYIPLWTFKTGSFDPVSLSDAFGVWSITNDTHQLSRTMSFESEAGNNVLTNAVIGMPCIFTDDPTFSVGTVPETYRHEFLGWISSFDVDGSRYGRTRFVVDGPQQWFDRLRGNNVRLNDRNTAPTKWYEMENITYDKALHYYLREYSTLPKIVSIDWSGKSGTQEAIEFGGTSVWEAVQDLTARFSAFVGFGSSPTMTVKGLDMPYTVDPHLESPDVVITEDDWYDDTPPTLVEDEGENVGLVDVMGAWWDGSTLETDHEFLLGARAPGLVAAQGSGTESYDFQYLAGSRDAALEELKRLVGAHYAKVNADQRTLQLQLAGNWDVFNPVDFPILALNTTFGNARQLNLSSSQPYVVRSVSVAHSNDPATDPKLFTVEVERLVKSFPGQEVEITDESEFDLSLPINPIRTPIIPDPVIPDLEDIAETDDGVRIGYFLTHSTDGVSHTFDFVNQTIRYRTIFDVAYQDVLSTSGRLTGTNTLEHRILSQHVNTDVLRVYKSTNTLSNSVNYEEEVAFDTTGLTVQVGSIFSSKEQDVHAVALLCDEGVYVSRKIGVAAWSSFVRVGGNFTDSRVTDPKSVGLYVWEDYVFVPGRSANDTYRLYRAQGSGAFATASTETFTTCPNTVDVVQKTSAVGELKAMVAAYADGWTAFTAFDNSEIVSMTREVLQAFPGTPTVDLAREYEIPGSDIDPDSFYEFEWTFDPDTYPAATQTSLTLGSFYLVASNPSATPPSGVTFSGGTPLRCEWEVSIETRNVGGINLSGFWQMENTGHTWTYIGVTAGPSYNYRLDPVYISGSETSVNLDLINDYGGPAEITSIRLLLVYKYNRPGPLGATTSAQHGKAEFGAFGHIDVVPNEGKFVLLNNVHSGGGGTVERDLVNQYGVVPRYGRSAFFDRTDETKLIWCGETFFLGASRYQTIRSTDSGVSQTILEDGPVNYWVKHARDVIVLGGEDRVRLSLNSGSSFVNRTGNINLNPDSYEDGLLIFSETDSP